MKNNSYGLKSLICFGISVICFLLYLLIFMFYNIEIVCGIFFYGAIILEFISLIFGVIGVIKDKKKLLSIIGIIIFLLIILGIIYYINIVLPKEINDTISSWQSSWGISG